MKRVVLIGLDPAAVNFSDPALPPGMTAEKIHAGNYFRIADHLPTLTFYWKRYIVT